MSEDPSNFREAITEPVTHWRIGRFWCPRCQTVKACIWEATVEVIVCDCGAVCEPSSGAE